jgi:hypothetical protein
MAQHLPARRDSTLTRFGLDSPPGLDILVRDQGTTIAIEMAGEWDLAALQAARQAIARALNRRPEWILLDLKPQTSRW